MECLNCESEEFLTENSRHSVEFKGETIDVTVLTQRCRNCKEPVMDSEQMNVLRKAAADKYRKLHGLLTSDQIINFRTKFGMSQSEFAKYLNVGEVSIKRWETYFVQDSSQDDHIRLKCDVNVAAKNHLLEKN